MAVKKNFIINLTMDWDHLQANGIKPPWFDITKLDLENLALFLQKHCYCGDKIEVLAADDYLDFIAIQAALKTGAAETLIASMSSVMDASKKMSGKAILPVSAAWRSHVNAICKQDTHSSPPPFMLFFQARGSSEETVGVWLGNLSSHMGVNPVMAAFTGKQSQGHTLFGALSSELQSVFGVKFIKDSGFSVI